jgi:hypothetical protein
LAKKEISNADTLRFHAVERAFDLAHSVIRWFGACVIAYVIYLAIRDLAGHQTGAQFLFGFFTDKNGGGKQAPWIGSSVLTTIWALFERWLRHRKVATMGKRLKSLEKAVNPERTGSGLDDSGRPPAKRRGKE